MIQWNTTFEPHISAFFIQIVLQGHFKEVFENTKHTFLTTTPLN